MGGRYGINTVRERVWRRKESREKIIVLAWLSMALLARGESVVLIPRPVSSWTLVLGSVSITPKSP